MDSPRRKWTVLARIPDLNLAGADLAPRATYWRGIAGVDWPADQAGALVSGGWLR